MTMGAEGAESDEVRGMWCTIRLAANAENIRTKDITFEKARLAAEAKAREAQQRAAQAQYEAQEAQKGEHFEEEQEKGEMF